MKTPVSAAGLVGWISAAHPPPARVPVDALFLSSLRFIVVALVFFFGAAAHAIPDAARTHADSWREQGRGEMRWFGLKLYNAELWVSSTRFDPARVYALKLTYARDFAGARLASSSIDEMQKQGKLDAATAGRWLKELERVFPNVKEGEQITGVYLPGKGAAFYHQGKLTGELNDAELARRFFDIWLDPRTSQPALRANLLGQKE